MLATFKITQVITLVLLAFSVSLPVPAGSFSRTYGGSGTDVANSVAPTTDGGFIVAGETWSSGAGNADGWILKLDSQGNVQWEKTFGATLNEQFFSVIQTSSGGFAVAGFEDSVVPAGGNGLIWVITLDAAGNILWQKSYGGNCLEVGRDIKELSAGGYVVAGNSCSFRQPGNSDGWVMELDPNGVVQWGNAYDFQTGTETLFSVYEKAGGGFVALGETDGHTMGTPDFDFWFLDLDGQGNTVRDWHAGGAAMAMNSGDSGREIQQTLDGGFIMTGETNQGVGTHDFWIIKTDNIGMIQWQNFYGAMGLQFLPRGIQQTLDRGYILGGFDGQGGAAYLLKLDGMGNLQWDRRYVPPGTIARFNDVKQAFDGGYIAAGVTFTGGNQDLWVVKTDPNGDINPGCLAASFSPANLAIPPPFTMQTPTNSFASAAVLTGTNTTVVGSAASPTPVQQCPVEVRVNQDISVDAQQEVSLAIDPNSPGSQVAVYIDDPDPATSGGIQRPSIGASATSDGGATWTDSQVQFGCDGIDDDMDGPIDEEMQCDGLDDDFDALIDEDPCCILEHFHPNVVSDLAGDFYTGYLAQDQNAPSFAGTSVIGAARSTDGGLTWSSLPPATITPFGPDVLPPFGLPDPVPNLDNPSFTVERNQGMPGTAALMAAWQRESNVSAVDTDVFAASLASGAGSWSTPTKVNDQPSLCAEAPVARWSVGHFWVAWRHGGPICGSMAQIYVDASFDNGLTFNALGPDRPGPFYNPIVPLRNHTFQPVDRFAFAPDPLNPVVLYLAYPEHPGFGLDEGNIMFTKSLDGGNSWEPPVKVNDDMTVTPQYAPMISVKVNANAWTLVDVAWYDERNSIGCDGLDDDMDGIADEERQNGMDDDGDMMIDEDLCDIRLDLYMARTSMTAGLGTLFGPNIRVTDSSYVSPNFPFPASLGEYLGSEADQYRTYVAWTDTRNGDNDVFTDTVTDSDSDGDLLTDGLDCSPADPTVKLKPGVVLNLTPTATMVGNVNLTWTSEDPSKGTATRYDIVTGLLSQLTVDGDYRNSTCLVDDHPDTPYFDIRPNPPLGDSYYYLIRAVNPCGSGTFGQNPANPMDPRHGLEDGAASLPNPDPCP